MLLGYDFFMWNYIYLYEDLRRQVVSAWDLRAGAANFDSRPWLVSMSV